MFSSEQVWQAVDRLASRNELSTSALSIRAGLDPTALNKSKRIGANGRPRWMSTETISKLLVATRTPLLEFCDMMHSPIRSLDEQEPIAADHARPDVRQARILVADSDWSFVDRVAGGLGAAGYDVHTVPDLRHALKVIERSPSLDLLITNLVLPHNAHGEVLAHIALTYHPRLKILFISNDRGPQPSMRNAENMVLPKNQVASKLPGLVSRLLRNGRQTSVVATSETSRASGMPDGQQNVHGISRTSGAAEGTGG